MRLLHFPDFSFIEDLICETKPLILGAAMFLALALATAAADASGI